MKGARPVVTMRATGERWFADPATFAEQLPELWGPWGCGSEVGRLRAVLMRRPGPEIDGPFAPEAVRFRAPMDADRARAQHDALADLYRQHGVAVHYVEQMRPDRPNAIYMRDLVAMTPEGAIVTRPAMSQRRGEERYAAEALSRLGVPILRTIAGTGIFEGANLMWASPNLAFIGVGNRTNPEGARQVAAELERMGVAEVLLVQIPYGYAHLDEFMNFADRDLAVLFPWQTPFAAVEALQRHGFRILEVDSPEEATQTFATNFVALEPGLVVMPAGNPRTAERLAEAGVRVIEAAVDELMKGWGAIHCLTAFLKRDDG